jgi:hypothetical protein
MATKIYTTDLKVGMFVADLDRPWVDTPFLLQGFLIEEQEQIATLRTHCEFVIVDRARSIGDQFEAPKPGDLSAPKVTHPPSPVAVAAAKAAASKEAAAAPSSPATPPRRAPTREGRVLRLEEVVRRGGSRAATEAPGALAEHGKHGRVVSGFKGLFGGR